MKIYTPETLLNEINKWRSLEAGLLNVAPGQSSIDAKNQLAEMRKSCKHKVYAHISTVYKDDGLCDPDFYSSYKCIVCGSNAYDVPGRRDEPDTFCINISSCNDTKNYSDTERFAVAEFRLKQLIKEHPDYTIKQIIILFNEELTKK